MSKPLSKEEIKEWRTSAIAVRNEQKTAYKGRVKMLVLPRDIHRFLATIEARDETIREKDKEIKIRILDIAEANEEIEWREDKIGRLDKEIAKLKDGYFTHRGMIYKWDTDITSRDASRGVKRYVGKVGSKDVEYCYKNTQHNASGDGGVGGDNIADNDAASGSLKHSAPNPTEAAPKEYAFYYRHLQVGEKYNQHIEQIEVTCPSCNEKYPLVVQVIEPMREAKEAEDAETDITTKD